MKKDVPSNILISTFIQNFYCLIPISLVDKSAINVVVWLYKETLNWFFINRANRMQKSVLEVIQNL